RRAPPRRRSPTPEIDRTGVLPPVGTSLPHRKRQPARSHSPRLDTTAPPPEIRLKRTDYCGLIDRRYLDQTVTLAGWVHRRRDHGGVIFIDLRDREGLVQIVCDPDRAAAIASAETLRHEYCIAVTGRVRPRPEGTVNPNLVSGEIEVLAHQIELLNASLTTPL